ncbi:MAG: DUF4476 domain-containing protein [Flavobacteriales bacterium]|nr:DUF4476 domain-containing protein [Flavobacteriales bacterium]
MKNLFKTLLVAFLAQNYIAQNTSNLVVFSEQGEQFYLIVNGVRQNENPETNIKVEGLNAEYYYTKVIFVDTTIPSLEKKMLQVRDAESQFAEVTYAIMQNKKGEYKMRWRTAVPIAQAPPATEQVRVIRYTTVPKPPIGIVTVSQTTTTTTQTGTTGESVNLNMNVDGVSLGVGINVNDGMGVGTTTTTQTTTVTSSSTTVSNGADIIIVDEPGTPELPGYDGAIGCDGLPMTDTDFAKAKQSIEAKDFSESRLTLAKQIANSNCLRAEQVKQIMELFDFENTKLEFAKYAYSRTYDIGNYYQVNDAFDFESSVDELNEYINQ